MTPRLAIALTTSTRFGSIAVAADGELVFEEAIEEGLVHGREIVRRLEHAFAATGHRPSDIDLVICDRGPGSFTGMRVGVTTAKTLAYAVGAQVVGIDAPSVIAANLPLSEGARTVLIDAKRNELYVAPFAPDGSALRATAELRLVPIDALAQTLGADTIVLGDGVRASREQLEEAGIRRAPDDASRPEARHVLALGLEVARAGHAETPDRLLPLYLRSSDPVIRKPAPRG